MLASTAEDDHPNVVRTVGPGEDLDDFGPEGAVHGVALFRSVDLHVGNLVLQLDPESLVIGHAVFPHDSNGRMKLCATIASGH